jgi:hypothetical protein
MEIKKVFTVFAALVLVVTHFGAFPAAAAPQGGSHHQTSNTEIFNGCGLRHVTSLA